MQRHPLAVALLCAVPVIHAQETVAPVVVTASRVAESVDETLAAVTVIDRPAIERSQAQTLADLLRATPGISLDVNGGRGKLTNLYLRGTDANHTLILVDGIRVGSATNGQVALQDIPAAQIDRIEVVRGPRSSLYGSEAIGGVIQIFTRRAEDGTRPNAAVTFGSYDSRESTAGANGRLGATWYSLQAQEVDTNGFDACPRCAEPDDDGYRSRSGSLRVGHRFASGLEAELHALRSESENEYDGAFQNESESMVEVAGARLGYDVAPFWHASLAAGQSKDESDNLKDGVFSSRFDTVRDNASLQNDLGFGNQLMTLGFDYLADRVDSDTAFAVESRINRGLFAQYRAALGSHDLQLAVRGDDNEQFGFHRTGNIAWGVNLDDGTRLTAAWGTAFKAPTFNDLYWPFGGNPDLKPETAASAEVGLQRLHGPVRMDLRLFRTDTDHLISWACTVNCADADFNNDIWLPMNVASARIDGMEVALSGQLSGWATRFALTLLDPRNEVSGHILPRRTRQAARLDLDRRFGPHSLGATLIAEGDRYDDQANTRKLAGYATVGLRTDYVIANDWHLGARVENLFDQEYHTAFGYDQPGRSYYVTIGYRP